MLGEPTYNPNMNTNMNTIPTDEIIKAARLRVEQRAIEQQRDEERLTEQQRTKARIAMDEMCRKLNRLIQQACETDEGAAGWVEFAKFNAQIGAIQTLLELTVLERRDG